MDKRARKIWSVSYHSDALKIHVLKITFSRALNTEGEAVTYDIEKPIIFPLIYRYESMTTIRFFPCHQIGMDGRCQRELQAESSDSHLQNARKSNFLQWKALHSSESCIYYRTDGFLFETLWSFHVCVDHFKTEQFLLERQCPECKCSCLWGRNISVV